MKTQSVVFFLIINFLHSAAQPVLKPHIGLSGLPADSDMICQIPIYQGNFNAAGYAAGDTVADFTLYTKDGNEITLSDLLLNGKPVLLVGGSYTCPVFRDKIADLNDMANYYAGQLQVYVVYTVEAHPVIDVSPYSGNVWTTSANQQEGVLFEQPKTYGERKVVLNALLSNYSIVPEILIDGPCNLWWSNYGPAPNNAYLINTDGIAITRHSWFHRTPENMWCAIDSLLSVNSGNCVQFGNNGIFSVTLDDVDSIAYGLPGEVLAVHSTITNHSTTENVIVRISKQQINVPNGWETALCADICYLTSVMQADITIPPGEKQPFIFYFYSDVAADTGKARIRFANLNNQSNVAVGRYLGITQEQSSVSAMVPATNSFSFYPNPAKHSLMVKSDETSIFELLDIHGKSVIKTMIRSGENQIDIKDVSNGVYLIRYSTTGIIKSERLIVMDGQ